jgi:hypothetical protein
VEPVNGLSLKSSYRYPAWKQILIAQKFIPAVSAELQRTSERERLKVEAARSKSCATRRHAKNGCASAQPPESAGLRLEIGISPSIDAGAEPLEHRLIDQAAERNYCVILARYWNRPEDTATPALALSTIG